MAAPVQKLALSVEECAQALGIKTTLCYRLVNEGKIPSIALGAKRVVPVKQLEERLEELLKTHGRSA